LHGFFERIFQIDRLHAKGPVNAIGRQMQAKFRASLGGQFDISQNPRDHLWIGRPHSGEGTVAEDGREQIVEFVNYASRDCTQTGHSLRLQRSFQVWTSAKLLAGPARR
jgi:hypothetical protein